MTTRHGQRSRFDNPFQEGMRVIYDRHISLFCSIPVPAVVVRPTTFYKTSIRFNPPLVMATGQVKKGMIVQNKLLRRAP